VTAEAKSSKLRRQSDRCTFKPQQVRTRVARLFYREAYCQDSTKEAGVESKGAKGKLRFNKLIPIN